MRWSVVPAPQNAFLTRREKKVTEMFGGYAEKVYLCTRNSENGRFAHR